MADGLTGTGRIRFHDDSSHGCCRRPQFLTTDLSTRMLQCPHNMAAGFARVSDPERAERKLLMPQWTQSQKSHTVPSGKIYYLKADH